MDHSSRTAPAGASSDGKPFTVPDSIGPRGVSIESSVSNTDSHQSLLDLRLPSVRELDALVEDSGYQPFLFDSRTGSEMSKHTHRLPSFPFAWPTKAGDGSAAAVLPADDTRSDAASLGDGGARVKQPVLTNGNGNALSHRSEHKESLAASSDGAAASARLGTAGSSVPWNHVRYVREISRSDVSYHACITQ